MLENLKHQVYKASLNLFESGLVIFTWGNISAIDREAGLVVIKPSGISYDEMIPADMVVIDLDGNIVEGRLEPSSDTAAHLAIYRNFQEVGAVVHSHSEFATSWAQAGRGIPAYGITHANYFNGEIPCTRPLTVEENAQYHDIATGQVIVETFKGRKLNPCQVPGVLVNGHGPFCWGRSVQTAMDHANAVEHISKIAFNTETLQKVRPLDKNILETNYKAVGDRF